jgi:uncharacterized protein (DUF433 family)
MNWRDRIETNPLVCQGKPCIKGTREMVSVILDNLAVGETAEGILRSYPSLRAEDVLVSLAYAAELACERIVQVPVSL